MKEEHHLHTMPEGVRQIFPYLPFFAFLLLVLVITSLKHTRVTNQQAHSGVADTAAVCQNYCSTMMQCVSSMAEARPHMARLDSLCLRGCEKNFARMQNCLQPSSQSDCGVMKQCLTQTLDREYGYLKR
ncbi:MAG: Cys-rich protein [Spirochaetia bacterium]|nr:Cys-rich protein [Spirochaetia bacterium]